MPSTSAPSSPPRSCFLRFRVVPEPYILYPKRKEAKLANVSARSLSYQHVLGKFWDPFLGSVNGMKDTSITEGDVYLILGISAFFQYFNG